MPVILLVKFSFNVFVGVNFLYCLIAPDCVAHSFTRDIAKPGAIKDRILIRLNLFELDIKLQKAQI
jgi:hypothetical protein